MPSPPSPSRPASTGRLASPRLYRLARGGAPALEDAEPAPGNECCELCGAPLPGEHRHLLELETRELLCACRPCSLLFDRAAASNGRYRLIPERRRRLDDLQLSDLEWEQLQIPVEMAFFFRSSAAGRVMAFYPSPMGPTESQLDLSAWQEIERSDSRLAEMEPDVEALLVYRPHPSRGARRQWLVPIDDCYRLVAVIRTRWRGFTGGKEVWLELERFFDDLDRRCRSQPRERRPDGVVR